MSIADNKRMALGLLHASARHDGRKFDELLHPEATYWVIGKPHLLDDSHSRRELTWSPSVGSFEQAMPQMAGWLSDLTGVEPVGRAEGLFDG